jgi:hypothetical protein
MREKEILDKLVNTTEKDFYDVKSQIAKYERYIDDGKMGDGDDNYRLIISELTEMGQEYQCCLDYLNKRLAEIDPNKPCEHYFAIAWIKKGKFKKHFYYKNCEFCGCEPLPTLRDLNK